MWSVYSLEDKDAWDRLLPASRNVFSSHSYSMIFKEHFGADARLFHYTDGNEAISYSFTVKPVDAGLSDAGDVCLDITSGNFGGPLRVSAASEAGGAGYYRAFEEYCRESGAVTEFIHLHPTDVDYGLLPSSSMELNREIVYVDLSWDDNRLWAESFGGNCEKNIKRAIRPDMEYRAAETEADVAEFHRIYKMTMDRVNALHKYYFSMEYFLDIFRRMPENSRFTLASHESKVVGALLALYDDETEYSFLCGFDADYKHLCATSGLHYEAIGWGRETGRKRYVLGGGYRPNDGVFQFKAGFSPLRLPFYVCKHVHQPERYASLCGNWEALNASAEIDRHFFPLYRGTPKGAAPSIEQQYQAQAAF